MTTYRSPHRRFNPLIGEWVLVSPQRTQRPWMGQVEDEQRKDLPSYDADCYLCPGNKRAKGQINPHYSSTYVFDNDYPALLDPQATYPVRFETFGSDVFQADINEGGDQDIENRLLVAEPESGICRVVCFSPRHDLSLAELPNKQVQEIIKTWIKQTNLLSDQEFIRYIQIFENRGAMMGASNPHPHCQIWATSHIPNEPQKERKSQEAYYELRGTCLLCDYLSVERKIGVRVIVENEYFTALVPYWAVWPFESMVVSNRHLSTLSELSSQEIEAFAQILRRLTTRYDNIFNVSFPYSMGFHQAPVNDGDNSNWHFHAHYYPPLLRSATVRKFMVGFEMLATPQRDITPEQAAQRLRAVSEVHFRS